MKSHSGLLALLVALLVVVAGCIFEEDDDESGSDVEAIFTWTPKTSIQAGTAVIFNGNASLPKDGSLTYRWDFDGDDKSDASGIEVSTTFAEAGTHDVTLTVTDGLEESSSTKSITILDKDSVIPMAESGILNPDADCDGDEASTGDFYLIYICESDKDSGDRNTRATTTINLDGSDSQAGSTNHYITSWVWDLNVNVDSDDNGISDDDNDAEGETYEWKDVEIGEAKISLTVTNNEGNSHSDEVMVHVQYLGEWEELHVNGNQTDGGELVFDTTFHYDRESQNKIKRVDMLLVYLEKDDDWIANPPDNKLDIHMFNSSGDEVVNTTTSERNQGCSTDEDYVCVTLQVTSYLIDSYEDGDWEIKIINGKAHDADEVEFRIEIQYK